MLNLYIFTAFSGAKMWIYNTVVPANHMPLKHSLKLLYVCRCVHGVSGIFIYICVFAPHMILERPKEETDFRNCSLNVTVYIMRICCTLLFCYFLIFCLSALALQPHKFIPNHVTDLILCLKEWITSKLPLLASAANCKFLLRDANFTPFYNDCAFKWAESAQLIFLGSVA